MLFWFKVKKERSLRKGSWKTEETMDRIKCDTHTHTLYSRHAYSTIEENVRAAAERGLEL